jgi:hypothetical protein
MARLATWLWILQYRTEPLPLVAAGVFGYWYGTPLMATTAMLLIVFFLSCAQRAITNIAMIPVSLLGVALALLSYDALAAMAMTTFAGATLLYTPRSFQDTMKGLVDSHLSPLQALCADHGEAPFSVVLAFPPDGLPEVALFSQKSGQKPLFPANKTATTLLRPHLLRALPFLTLPPYEVRVLTFPLPTPSAHSLMEGHQRLSQHPGHT